MVGFVEMLKNHYLVSSLKEVAHACFTQYIVTEKIPIIWLYFCDCQIHCNHPYSGINTKNKEICHSALTAQQKEVSKAASSACTIYKKYHESWLVCNLKNDVTRFVKLGKGYNK